MNLIYYIEVNLICILVLLIFQRQMKERYNDKSTEKAIFVWMLSANILFCLSDILAGVFRGKIFTGARELIKFSNIIYYESLAIIAFLWFMYVIFKLNILKITQRKKIFLCSTPMILFTLIVFVDPFTDFLFYIDEHNRYVRNTGVYLHWIITWGYLIASTIITIIKLKQNKNKQRRKDIIPLLYFIIAPTITSVIQMFFYGVTCTQAGVTLSLALIFVNNQQHLVLMDSLTGMNNRKGLYYFFEDRILNRSQADVTLMMLDLNDFKYINDTYGHLVGDQALIIAAKAVRHACYKTDEAHILCRYGGDEFVIVSIDSDEEKNAQIIETIDSILREHNKKENTYILEFGIGQASGICRDVDDFEALLKKADIAMYENKEQLKSAKHKI